MKTADTRIDLRGLAAHGPIHFVGIAGAGMSALAELLLASGGRRSGCDLESRSGGGAAACARRAHHAGSGSRAHQCHNPRRDYNISGALRSSRAGGRTGCAHSRAEARTGAGRAGESGHGRGRGRHARQNHDHRIDHGHSGRSGHAAHRLRGRTRSGLGQRTAPGQRRAVCGRSGRIRPLVSNARAGGCHRDHGGSRSPGHLRLARRRGGSLSAVHRAGLAGRRPDRGLQR